MKSVSSALRGTRENPFAFLKGGVIAEFSTAANMIIAI
jgi:hypothetical protein